MKINNQLTCRLSYSEKGPSLVASAETAVSAIDDPIKKDGIWHRVEEYGSDERGWDDNSESFGFTRRRDEQQEESNPNR